MESQELNSEKHVRLARSVAKRFVKCRDSVDDSDAFGNALLALVEASRTWLPSMNVCFSTYARRCIFNALIDIYRKEITHRLPETEVSEDFLEDFLLVKPQKPSIDPEVMETLMRVPADPQEAKDHQMVLERFLDGMSYAELGRARGISAMAAWNAVRRGVARIRRDHAGLLASDSVVWELPEGDLRGGE
jgi:RNA polymerase sigma factor (sigma-70 family)